MRRAPAITFKTLESVVLLALLSIWVICYLAITDD
jgi:hypothetical protein